MLIEPESKCNFLNRGLRIWTWLALVVFFDPFGSVAISSRPASVDRCDLAQGRCVQNPECLVLLRRYLTYCSDLIDGRVTSTCWPRCRRVLPLLMDHPDGRSFATCDCHGNEPCVAQQQRLYACSRGFDSSSERRFRPVAKDGADVPCAVARRNCFEDEVCPDALSVTNMVCEGVARTGRCGKACRNSLETMYQNDRGRRVVTCLCDERRDDDPHRCNTLLSTAHALCHRHRKQAASSAHAPKTTTPNHVTRPVTSTRHHSRTAFQVSGGNSTPTTAWEMVDPRGTADVVARILGESDDVSRTRSSSATSHVTKLKHYNRSKGSTHVVAPSRRLSLLFALSLFMLFLVH